MSNVNAELDKKLDTALPEGHGTIAIRVVVLQKGMAAAPAPVQADETPVDAEPDEMLPETDKRPISSFLEESKRGKYCCVFLINGQRQHVWDNQFIIRDLEMKYLRNRMIVVVECDGLRPEASAELMQGSRNQFYEGQVYDALASRVTATLKGDPELRLLEEQAEEEISSLQAGDEAVKAALDQLIESHHNAAAHADHGHSQAGDASRDETSSGSLLESKDVVTQADPSVGLLASDPVLLLHPDVVTVRLKPKVTRRLAFVAKPDTAWNGLEHFSVTFDPPVKELLVSRTSQINGEEVALTFAEPEDFDNDEYPIETVMRATATFKGYPEVRLLERRLVITPPSIVDTFPILLKDDPTFIRVTSRQPIKLLIGGPDVHVKLRWDGKDELVAGNPPAWFFRITCESPSIEPTTFPTRPVNGRFELLIQATTGLKAGEQIKFDVEAVGPGKTLATAFLVDVTEPPSARKISTKMHGGAQRRPAYELKYVTKENWGEETCWGQNWSGNDPGSFEEPNAKSPLTIFVNQDMDLLATYRDSLLEKKNAESTIQQRINKYTAHVAFHLYQIFERKREVLAHPNDLSSGDVPSEEQMRDEIRRVGRTLLRLMQVA